MKCLSLTALVVALALVAQPAKSAVVSCDFANVANASILFTGTGNTIQFPNTGAYDFLVTAGTAPSLLGLQGNIGGTFTVGTITTIGLIEQASITTTDGTFSVDDGFSNTLTADLDWKDILVFSQLVGGLNVTGIANLDNISYSGSNSALLDIMNGTDQTAVLTFQFSPLTKKSLAELMADGQVNSTSYSGSVSAVPEPSSCVLLVTAVLGLLACVWRGRS